MRPLGRATLPSTARKAPNSREVHVRMAPWRGLDGLDHPGVRGLDGLDHPKGPVGRTGGYPADRGLDGPHCGLDGLDHPRRPWSRRARPPETSVVSTGSTTRRVRSAGPGGYSADRALDGPHCGLDGLDHPASVVSTGSTTRAV